MIKSGIAIHCSHWRLYDYVYDYDEREKYIQDYKPPEERPLRLRLFQLVPADRLPGRDSPAWAAYDKARATYNKAWDAYAKARDTYDKAVYDKAALHKAGAAYDKAWPVYDNAKVACDKARAAYEKCYSAELLTLHAELCPDCPWDGATIFTRKNEVGEWY